MCPSALESEYEIMQKIHPEYKKLWDSYLKEWMTKNNYNENYIKYGLWRWKKLPPKMYKLIKDN